jgi:hypothetical protein
MKAPATDASVTALTEALATHDTAAMGFAKAAERHFRKARQLSAQLEQLKRKAPRREVAA